MVEVTMYATERRDLENCIKNTPELLPELGDECLIRLNHQSNFIRAIYDPRSGPGDGIFMTQNFQFTQFNSSSVDCSRRNHGVVEFLIIKYSFEKDGNI